MDELIPTWHGLSEHWLRAHPSDGCSSDSRMAIPQSSSWEPHFESFGTQEVDLATIAAVFPSPTSILVNVLAMFASFYHSVFVGLSMFIMPLLVETVETPSFAHVLLLGSIDIESQEAATLRIMKHPWSSSTSKNGNGKKSPENHGVKPC